jgi:hypothetical protein
MLDNTSDDVIVAAVRNVFTDPHFSSVGILGYRAEIDGVIVGVVAATKSQQFADSLYHVLNKPRFDKLLEGLNAGRLHRAYVVTTALTQSGRFTGSIIEARELAEMLRNETPRIGRYGDFYLVPSDFNFTKEEDF